MLYSAMYLLRFLSTCVLEKKHTLVSSLFIAALAVMLIVHTKSFEGNGLIIVRYGCSLMGFGKGMDQIHEILQIFIKIE